MARKRREWFPGARFHITARGNRREAIFYDEEDFAHYLELLESCNDFHPFILHAYCLMTNHIHLLLEVKQDPPGKVMKFIHSRYAVYFNKRHKKVGHVFQDRYYSRIIDSDAYLLSVSQYIHLNPLEANMTSEPENYPWSSFSSYVSDSTITSYMDTSFILAHFAEPKRERYYNYVMRKKGEA